MTCCCLVVKQADLDAKETKQGYQRVKLLVFTALTEMMDDLIS